MLGKQDKPDRFQESLERLESPEISEIIEIFRLQGTPCVKGAFSILGIWWHVCRAKLARKVLNSKRQVKLKV